MVSPTLAGELNRARVLKTLYAMGPLPRPELARRTGSNRATIGAIVQPLLDEGVLAEGEPIASGAQGGKPARPLWFTRDGWRVGAVVLLPDEAQVALVSAGGTVTASTTVSYASRPIDFDDVVRQVAAAVDTLAEGETASLRGVGVAVGGLVDTGTGDIVAVELAPRFNGMPVGRALSEVLGVPVHVDNHARALALGDLLFGLGRGHDSFCSLYLGEGIGAGFIIDGTLQRGRRGAGGEVGHAVVDRGGPRCACGRFGCWETVAANRWLRREAAARGVRGARTVTVARLAARPDDTASAALLADYVTNVSLGIVNVQHTLGLGLFVVHGAPVGGGEVVRQALEDDVRARTFDHPGSAVQIRFADADDHTAVRGAAAVVLSRSLHVAF